MSYAVEYALSTARLHRDTTQKKKGENRKMTREDAIKEIEKVFEPAFANYIVEALTKGATVSEQEPTTKNDLGVDCISRKSVITIIQNHWWNCRDIDKLVNELPSVTPQPKTGHWIDGHCSECGCDVPAYIVDWKWQKDMDAKFCPNCGAKMDKGGRQ